MTGSKQPLPHYEISAGEKALIAELKGNYERIVWFATHRNWQGDPERNIYENAKLYKGDKVTINFYFINHRAVVDIDLAPKGRQRQDDTLPFGIGKRRDHLILFNSSNLMKGESQKGDFYVYDETQSHEYPLGKLTRLYPGRNVIGSDNLTTPALGSINRHHAEINIPSDSTFIEYIQISDAGSGLYAHGTNFAIDRSE
ncbi:MAG: FHA domain-containing protein [Ktedonobacteraceae bacterium]